MEKCGSNSGLTLPNRAFYQLNYTRIFSFLHDTTQRKKKQVFRVCGRRCGHAQFFGSFSTEEFPPQATVPRTSGILLSGEWMSRLSSQITCAINCATPGYSIFLHDTMRRRKKQVFRVCGRRCGQARFCGDFSAGKFPPQTTVPRTSEISLSREWMGHLSSKSKHATNCAIPGYSVFLHDIVHLLDNGRAQIGGTIL